MKRLKVELLESALDDLRRTRDYIAEKASPTIARRYLGRVEAACAELGNIPYVGTARDDLLPGLRTVGFERRATIAFRVLPGRVQVVNVFYGGRNVEAFYSQQHDDQRS